MKPSYFFCFALAVLSLQTSPRTGRAGTSAEVLTFPVGVRSYGMGLTGVADNADPANAYFSPANLVALRGVHLSGALAELLPDLLEDVTFKSLGLAVGRGNLGLELRFGRIGYGESVARGPANEDLGTFSSHENYLAVAVGVPVPFSNRVETALGISAKYWWGSFAPSTVTLQKLDESGRTVAFDIGLRVAGALIEQPGFTLTPAIGASYQNLGPGIEFVEGTEKAELPETLRLGISLKFETSPLPGASDWFGRELSLLEVSANLDLSSSRANDKSTVYGLGLEAAILKIVFVRLGYVQDSDEDIEGLTFGLGAGIAVEWFEGRFDYARVPQAETLDDVNKFGLSLGYVF